MILIGTPIYDDQLLLSYHEAILDLLDSFRAARPEVRFRSMLAPGALVSHSRNAMATRVLREPDISHLLFIDADMGFRPALIEKMLDLDVPIAGCVYPARRSSPARFAAVAREAPETPHVLAIAQEYVMGVEAFYKSPPDGRLEVRDGFARARYAGTGIMLLRREVLERMADAYPDLWSTAGDPEYERLGVEGPVFQPFEALRSETGLFLGEDLSFCRRWSELGGDIWSCFTEPVIHAGRQRFIGQYEHRLRYESAQRRRSLAEAAARREN